MTQFVLQRHKLAVQSLKSDVPLSERLTRVLIPVYVLYISVYGLVSMYTNSQSIRSIKDVFLALFVFMGVTACVKGRLVGTRFILLYFFFFAVALISFLVRKDAVSFVYGMKISLLPMGMFFFGAQMSAGSMERFGKLLMPVFFMLITGWLIEYQLGIHRLMNLGFQYGVNIKNFGHLLRLPSTVGAPDSYALYLSILCALIVPRLKGWRKASFVAAASGFIVYSTVRSSVLFWFTFLLLYGLNFLIGRNKAHRSLFIAIGFFLVCTMILILPSFFSSSSFAATGSLEDRFSHWFVNLQPLNQLTGVIGLGLGSVGAASRKLASMGFDNSGYAVDNQFFAWYIQMGIAGVLVYVTFLAMLFHKLLKIKNNSIWLTKGHAIALLIAAQLSCLVTNIMELFPFNVIFWMALGMVIQSANKKVQNRPALNRIPIDQEECL